MPIALQNITCRTVSNTVGPITTILAIVDHPGPPSRTFFHSIQQPEIITNGQILNLERQAIERATDQFLIWVQNGKP